jgi:hypothetical protein
MNPGIGALLDPVIKLLIDTNDDMSTADKFIACKALHAGARDVVVGLLFGASFLPFMSSGNRAQLGDFLRDPTKAPERLEWAMEAMETAANAARVAREAAGAGAGDQQPLPPLTESQTAAAQEALRAHHAPRTSLELAEVFDACADAAETTAEFTADPALAARAELVTSNLKQAKKASGGLITEDDVQRAQAAERDLAVAASAANANVESLRSPTPAATREEQLRAVRAQAAVMSAELGRILEQVNALEEAAAAAAAQGGGAAAAAAQGS